MPISCNAILNSSDVKPTIGPPIENGFYYDFHMNPISEEDLRAIEKRTKALVKQNLKVEREWSTIMQAYVKCLLTTCSRLRLWMIRLGR